MVDCQDYAYTMVVKKEQGEQEINSDNLIYLIQLGTAGLELGIYDSATIHCNLGATYASS
jgi:hypothetical protein